MAQENQFAVSRFPVPELKDMPEDIRDREKVKKWLAL